MIFVLGQIDDMHQHSDTKENAKEQFVHGQCFSRSLGNSLPAIHDYLPVCQTLTMPKEPQFKRQISGVESNVTSVIIEKTKRQKSEGVTNQNDAGVNGQQHLFSVREIWVQRTDTPVVDAQFVNHYGNRKNKPCQ